MRPVKHWFPLAVALVTAAPTLAAQVTVTPRARGRAYNFDYESRPRIGVVVNTNADAQSDRIGARLEAVTPGGPADKAGLKAGDIITKFNGTALGGVRSSDEDESGPGTRLVELARALDAGDSARVEYRRGTENKTATIVAEDMGGYTVVTPDIRVFPKVGPGAGMWWGGGDMEWMMLGGMNGSWGGLQLVTLEPDLGEYFGVREGLLVLKASGDSTLPLKAGDVILSFDGRKPASPSHAMRILRSYEAGEQVVLEVQRKQRKMSVNWTVPEDEHTEFRRTPGPARRPSTPRPSRSPGRTEES